MDWIMDQSPTSRFERYCVIHVLRKTRNALPFENEASCLRSRRVKTTGTLSILHAGALPGTASASGQLLKLYLLDFECIWPICSALSLHDADDFNLEAQRAPGQRVIEVEQCAGFAQLAQKAGHAAAVSLGCVEFDERIFL